MKTKCVIAARVKKPHVSGLATMPYLFRKEFFLCDLGSALSFSIGLWSLHYRRLFVSNEDKLFRMVLHWDSDSGLRAHARDQRVYFGPFGFGGQHLEMCMNYIHGP